MEKKGIREEIKINNRKYIVIVRESSLKIYTSSVYHLLYSCPQETLAISTNNKSWAFKDIPANILTINKIFYTGWSTIQAELLTDYVK